VKSVAAMSLGEFAAYVSSHLRKHGIRAVLSGGACVSVYTRNRYQSYDLDFIENVPAGKKRLREVMSLMGFAESGRYFKHPDTAFFVDFLAGPLAVGNEAVHDTQDMTLSTGTLVLLSPTDCVKDRLAAYYHWGDKQCLEQALLVTESAAVDLRSIRRWSSSEGKLSEFETIRKQLLAARRKGK
jgi:hypothetical protein